MQEYQVRGCYIQASQLWILDSKALDDPRLGALTAITSNKEVQENRSKKHGIGHSRSKYRKRNSKLARDECAHCHERDH